MVPHHNHTSSFGAAPRRPRILVTGFGPFPGVPYNASATLLRLIASEPDIAGIDAAIDCGLLPTAWRGGVAEAARLIDSVRPDAVLHFGVSSRATGFQIEARAHNFARRMPDCEGCLNDSYYVGRGGLPSLPSSLPADLLLRALRRKAIRASISHDAGRYLCNAVLYNSLWSARRSSRPPLVGFIHIPALRPPHIADPRTGGLPREWSEMRDGLVIILRTLATFLRMRRQRSMRPVPNRLRTVDMGSHIS